MGGVNVVVADVGQRLLGCGEVIPQSLGEVRTILVTGIVPSRQPLGFEEVGDLGDFVFGQASRSQWLLGDAFAVWRVVVARSAALADSSSRTFTTTKRPLLSWREMSKVLNDDTEFTVDGAEIPLDGAMPL